MSSPARNFPTVAHRPTSTLARALRRRLGRPGRLIATAAVTVSALAAMPAAASAVIPSSGESDMLIVPVYWNGQDLAGAQGLMTTERMESVVAQANDWFEQASDGRFQLHATITDWLPIAAPTNGECGARGTAIKESGREIAKLWLAQANIEDHDELKDFTSVVFYYPYHRTIAGTDCNWLGAAAGNEVVINGLSKLRDFPNPTPAQLEYAVSSVSHVLVHETGHLMGLRHGRTNLCTEVITGTCTYNDTGDPFDIYSGPQKDQIGWLDEDELVDATNGTTTTLLPFASLDDGPKVIKIDAGGGRSYWLEYHQPIGVDVELPADATDGLQLRVMGPGSGIPEKDGGSSLLDVRPNDGLSPHSATLQPGKSWTSPEGIEMTLVSANAQGAAVTVRRAPQVMSNMFIAPDALEPRYAVRVKAYGHESVQFAVQYGEHDVYESMTTPITGTPNEADEVLMWTAIPNLVPGKTYHYRAMVMADGRYTTTEEATFIAPGLPVVSESWIWGSAPEPVYAARVNTFGRPVTNVTIDYGTTTSYGQTVRSTPPLLPAGDGNVLISTQFANITPGVTYHYRVKLTTATGTTTLPDQTFQS